MWHVTVDQNWDVNIAEYRRGHGALGRFLGGGFILMLNWTVATLLGQLAAGEVLSDPVLVAAATVPIVQTGGAFWIGAAAAAIATRLAGGFTPGLFAAVGAVALARWAGLG